MKFELDKRDQFSIFKLEEDRLDSALSPQLKSEFVVLTTAEGIKNLLVDLSEVRFADSSGLSSLLVAQRAISAKGGIFGLVNASPSVEKLIGISHLDRVIMMYDNIEDAIIDFKIQIEEQEGSGPFDEPFSDELDYKSATTMIDDDGDDFEDTDDEFDDSFDESSYTDDYYDEENPESDDNR